MTKKTLKSGRNVLINEIYIDDIDTIKDSLQVTFKDNAPNSVLGLNKQKTLWVRKGLGGGDFNGWDAKVGVSDSIIRQLSEEEKDELVQTIQEVQSLGEKVPSNSSSTV